MTEEGVYALLTASVNLAFADLASTSPAHRDTALWFLTDIGAPKSRIEARLALRRRKRN